MACICSLEWCEAGILTGIIQGINRLALGRPLKPIKIDVPDAFFIRLQQLFTERGIVELTAHIAHENYNAKSN